MRFILLFFMLMLLPIHAKADQFMLLTYEQAMKAKKFLDNEEYVITYCTCCQESKKEYIKINNVSVEKYPNSFDGKEYYTVTVTGINPLTNKPMNEMLDLAYSFFVRSDQMGYSVGIVLDLEVDPCNVDQIEVDRRIKSNKKFVEKEKYYSKF